MPALKPAFLRTPDTALPGRSASSKRGSDPRRHTRAFATYLLAGLATLGLVGTCAAQYGGGASPSLNAARPAAGINGGPRSPAPRVQLADIGESWPRSIFEGLFGIPKQSEPRRARRPAARPQERRRHQTEPRTISHRAASQKYARPSDSGGTYRTMCVRLCDGFYWPISFATSAANFARDSKICSQSCGSPAALYYYPNPGGEPEDMISLDGRPYKSLRTAFLHYSAYDADCKCRPHPWEAEAAERHRKYTQSKEPRAAAQNSPRRR